MAPHPYEVSCFEALSLLHSFWMISFTRRFDTVSFTRWTHAHPTLTELYWVWGWLHSARFVFPERKIVFPELKRNSQDRDSNPWPHPRSKKNWHLRPLGHRRLTTLEHFFSQVKTKRQYFFMDKSKYWDTDWKKRQLIICFNKLKAIQ